ncbi:hypothetical protein [Hydrocarboniphaga daqingensis]|uniref:hypothetical protein n=1 Tax=Hydrocarboniphaga daqingensis TaxID=490188 RepID=UPI00111491D9|nr:hypothetical protein [Hydrocarboniphaga daqingensis]
MRKITIPVIAYMALSLVYFSQSGAPIRVHTLSLAVLAVAFLIPSVWSAHIGRSRGRLVVCGLCAFFGMLAWDATAHLVIAKAEQFSILLSTPWLYALGWFPIVVITFSTAWVASPPNPALQPTSSPSASPRLS